ncbi:NAD(P)H-hydrate dehydratase [Thetidibacter halocola]|uniref:Bifunctional NAD(P)H-hydrate repair enzyme n=1 Tax=Thetidibacter halocola TaxID=2827239 RepID=A0A8J7WFE5_9RHOB|nr:NAD(P)H-hydrate dehydratase [Thetidibacter halocola]MBS0124164.1 NAD(P)H-hydrate dehydratase [Thetidibacter halocola]
MTDLLTAAQMRAVERAAIESGSVTGLELMERAGAGVVEAVLEEWPELVEGTHRAVVLCGPGNNGGDGFVVARLLKERGWSVEVFLFGDAGKLPPDAKTNFDRWSALGAVGRMADWSQDLPDLVVDALFGTGLTRPVEGLFDEFLHLNEETLRSQYFRYANLRVTSIDMPSGVCSDSGRILEPANWTEKARWWRPTALAGQLTVTFHSMKPGHVLADGPGACGKVVVKDIGLEPSRGDDAEIARIAARPDLWSLGKRLGHKYDHGHALLLSGGAGRTGAARLAARGALRIGAGLVTLGVPGSAQMEVAAQVTAIMLRRVEDADGLAAVLEDMRFNALCLGPGLGLDRARELAPVAVRAEHAPYVVLDADALTAFAGDPEALRAMLHDRCVLTPHDGEFARLFPDIAERLNAPATTGPVYSKVDATRAAAKRAGCIVLFKGPDTVIAAPDGRASVNAAVYERAAPWLATAGSGDVLAGFITGLLARGFDPMQAAETAAWLHVECARRFGPGLIAEDLPETLPAVFRDLAL